MEHKKTVLRKDFSVEGVISVHYFEYAFDFTFSGELHDFWELVYADKGELLITADSHEFILPQGALYLHKPMEFHCVRPNGDSAPNSVNVTFASDSEKLYELAGKMLSLNSFEKTCLTGVVEEAKEAFSSPLGDPFLDELVRKKNSSFGSEQMLLQHLEALFVSLVRRNIVSSKIIGIDGDFTRRRKDELRLRQICEFLEDNVEKDLSSADIQRRFYISESSLQKLFQHKVGCGAMQHFQYIKIDRAKELIRENKMNFSEISEKLSFSSIHYFSRRFKALTGMTPSEYAASIQSYSSKKNT